MFYGMLYADALRGMDATGVIGVMNNGDFGIMKEATEAAYFTYTYNNSELKKELFRKGAAVIGHNRAKTVGENKDENAHPFVVDKTFAMVHNGTLRNHTKLAQTTVDSEALAIVIKNAMDQDDWKKALEEAMSNVEGAYAVSWYDQKRNEMCVLRNKERPLGFVHTSEGVLFASEPMMAGWIAGRCGVKVEKFEGVKEHTLIKFDLNKGGATFEEVPLALPLPKKYSTGGFQNGTTKSVAGSQCRVPATVSTNKVSSISQLLKKVRSAQEPASKNMVKRFRRKLINKEILFEMDDYVEKDLVFDVSPCNDFLLLGESKNGAYDLCDIRHVIKAPIKLSDLKMSQKEMEKEVYWVGDVERIEFNNKSQTMEIFLKATVPTKTSTIILANETKH